MNSRPRVLIVGGYGHVGRRIAARLVQMGDASVVIGGRDLAKAERVAAEIGGSAVRIDLLDPSGWAAALAAVDLVAVCIDQVDATFPAFVLRSGCLYVDITANDAMFRQIEAIEDLARAHDGAAILSVGFAPGLTNLMVKACAAQLDVASEARIGILLGLGDGHGAAAIGWTIDNLFAAQPSSWSVSSFGFGAPARRHPVMPFDFADQHVVRRTLGLPVARTYLTFDSALLSRLIFAVARLPLGRSSIAKVSKALLPHMRIGSDRAALAVEVRGERSRQPRVARAIFEGRREADLTALVAAETVRQVLRARPAAAIHHLEQILPIEALIPALAAEGGRLDLEGPVLDPGEGGWR